MDLTQFGPFAAQVAVAFALLALFSTFLARMIGDVDEWSRLMGGVPKFVVTLGPRAIVIAAIGLTYFTLTNESLLIYISISILAAIATSILTLRYFRQVSLFTCKVPLLTKDGKHAVDKRGKELSSRIIVGAEETMRPEAFKKFAALKEENGGLSLCQFLAGYGGTKTYDPEAAWSREILVEISSSLLTKLMLIISSGVLVLYWVAAVVELSIRVVPPHTN